ncbi:potassium-transporting ATPase subunit F [Leptolyngbya sp. AN02str]|uniref:potassium-transporting ATPase subunit F n=1 Tax=Leptolyngbya sp. AN02str TaxID=3423363 RepID=UPI003D31DFFB
MSGRHRATEENSPILYLSLPTYLALCFNLLVAPIVYAASSNEFSRSQAWSLGLLGLGTVALSIYLFFVMFVPEKF